MIKIGQKYGNWTALKATQIKNKKQLYLCKCNCGLEKEVRSYDLMKSKSLFCLHCRHASVSINIGDTFGKWTVLEQVETEEKRKHYKVQCSCGTIKILKGIRLRFGDSISCRKCGSTKHGMVHSRTYATWESMIQRCTNIKNRNYRHYGARGIKVCQRWLTFENFLEDMGKRPNNLELDRINNNGNYELSNCRWVTRTENLNNRIR